MRTTDACPTWCKGHSTQELSAGGDTTLLHLGPDDDFEGIALGHLTAEDGVTEYRLEFDYAGDHSVEELRELVNKLADETKTAGRGRSDGQRLSTGNGKRGGRIKSGNGPGTPTTRTSGPNTHYPPGGATKTTANGTSSGAVPGQGAAR